MNISKPKQWGACFKITTYKQDLHGLPKRIGSGVSRPTLCVSYANRRSPSFKMFFAAFTSLSCVVPHSGQVHSRTDKLFVPDH